MRLALLLAAFAVLAGCATIKGWFTPAAAPAEVQEPEEAARRSAQPPPSPAPPPPPPAAPPPPAPPPPPVLSPDLSAADEQKLRAQTLERIDGTEERLRKIDAAKLASAQQDNLRTVQSFLDKAREALRVQEFQRAFTLADKAYLLADELLRSSR